jgi:hypothetical protein
MRKSAVLIVIVCTASVNAARTEPMVRHAGEWESTVNNGKPTLLCFPTDKTFDEKTIMAQMSKLPGANCAMGSMNTVGNVTSYTVQCTIGGSQMTSSGTITVTGPDAYTGKSHSHGGKIPMPNGQVMDMPDMDTTTVSHRTGPCKPGDRVVQH